MGSKVSTKSTSLSVRLLNVASVLGGCWATDTVPVASTTTASAARMMRSMIRTRTRGSLVDGYGSLEFILQFMTLPPRKVR